MLFETAVPKPLRFFHRQTRRLELVNTYARLNLKAKASKTYLSYAWWIIEPLLFVAIYYFVFTRVLANRPQDFVLFLFAGKIPFLWIAKSITNTSGSILANKGLLGQSAIQPALFPLVVLQENFYKQIPVFIMLLGLLLFFGVHPGWGWLWLLPLICLNYLFLLPVALAGALVTAFIPDARLMLSLLTTFLMFVSGVFWDIRSLADVSLQHALLVYNPVAFLLDTYRAVLIYQETPDLSRMVWLTLLTSLTLALIVYLYGALRGAISKCAINQ